MITIQKQNNLIIVAVIGEFTLSDYQSFEDQIIHQSTSDDKINILVDLRDMLDYTVDVAWEDIKFMHQHRNDFDRIAVITDDQLQSWSAWISNLFINAEVSVFEDYDVAIAWVNNNSPE